MNSIPEPEASSIRVAEYLTELPPREMLGQKLKGSGGDCTGKVRGEDGGGMKGIIFENRTYRIHNNVGI